jgi:hypothetical protein
MITFEDANAHGEQHDEGVSAILLESFRSLFENFDFSWRPSPREQKILQGASSDSYGQNGIETIFFRHGRWTGIIGLVLFFRTKDQKLWTKLVLSEVEELAKNVSQLPSPQVRAWMEKFSSEIGTVFFLTG